MLGTLIEDPRPLRLHRASEHPRAYGLPPGHPPMETFLGVPILVRGETWGHLYLTEKAGGADFDEADEQTAVVLAEWAAIAVANARLHRDVEARRDELQEAVLGLEATTDIARAVGGELDLGRVLELIVERGRALVGARALTILLTDGEDFVYAAAAGDVRPGVEGRRLPLAGSACARALHDQRPVQVRDVRGRLGMVRGAPGIDAPRAVLLVPLVFRGRSLGDLAAFEKLGADTGFAPRDDALPSPSRPAPPPRWPPRGRWPRSACATACGPRRPSARGGRASCTTRRSRAWAPCA